MTPGFHPRVNAASYHADPCVMPSLSSSIAQILLRESPRKAWHSHPRLNQEYREVHDDKFDLGKAAHAALLEADLGGIEVIDPANHPSKTGSIPDGWTNNAIRAARDTARAAGKTPILKRHHDEVMAMVKTAKVFIAASEIAEYWGEAESEVTGVCNEDSVWLRCRFDRITKNRRLIVDYKSTEDASPEPFSRLLVRMGYHVQEAFYRRVARNLGVVSPRFVFLAQSVEPPHECSLHGCDPSLQEIADAQVERAIQLWRQCVKTKQWPSYGGRIHFALPSSWLIADHEQRVLEEAA